VQNPVPAVEADDLLIFLIIAPNKHPLYDRTRCPSPIDLVKLQIPKIAYFGIWLRLILRRLYVFVTTQSQAPSDYVFAARPGLCQNKLLNWAQFQSSFFLSGHAIFEFSIFQSYNIPLASNQKLTRTMAPALARRFPETLLILQLSNLTENFSRIAIRLAKSVAHFVPLHRLSNILNSIVEVGIRLINQQSSKIERNDLRIFLACIMKVGNKRISFVPDSTVSKCSLSAIQPHLSLKYTRLAFAGL
jgi:hypothetical protein